MLARLSWIAGAVAAASPYLALSVAAVRPDGAESGAPHEPNANAGAAVGPHHAGDRVRAPLGAAAIIG